MIKYGYFRAYKKNSNLITYITLAFEPTGIKNEYRCGFAVCEPFREASYCGGLPFGDRFRKKTGRNIAKGLMQKKPYRFIVNPLDEESVILVMWSLFESAVNYSNYSPGEDILPVSVRTAFAKDMVRFGLNLARDKAEDQ